MNFKEIRLVGFKSFADKTSIKFDDGVTCIVGPNGCGKSNVADAVRWVLGEQSAKTLRGSNMTDVIFSGSEVRRQLSFCEVTLVFDNSQKLFDIDYDEVAMTRRLYRSGDSEYLLNMQPCRLKDIVALLHGVGIGKEGYSIIGQGKVAQIMNSKPVDRRTIFEEATGVMKFKSQKGEIERKLQSARDNLTVYVQRMDEAERNLRPLEKQAETAKKFREYSAQLKYEEVNAYLVRSDSFEQETAAYQQKIDEASHALEGIESRLSALDGEEERCRERVAETDAELRDINEKLRYFEVGLERKSGTSRVMNAKIDSYRNQLREAADEVAYSQRRMREIEAGVAESKKSLEEGEKRSREIADECTGLNKKLREADARVSVYERLSDERRANEIASMENLADARAATGSLSAKRDAANDRIGEVRAAIGRAEARRKDNADRLAECAKEKAAVEAFLDAKPAREKELLETIEDLTASSRKISQEMVDCNTSIANQSNNLQWAIDLKNRFAGYKDSVRRLLLEGQHNPEVGRRIKACIADVIHTDKKFVVAIETVIGGSMHDIITVTARDAQYLIQYLKEHHLGVVTFLPVDNIHARADSRDAERALGEQGALGLATKLVEYEDYYDNIVRHLLGNTLVCDNIANATRIMYKYPGAFRIVTLDGDTIATSGSMTGGSRKNESGNLLAVDNNIKELEEDIKRKKGLLEKYRIALSRTESDLEEARKAYEEFRLEVQQKTADFAALAQREMAISGLIADAEGEADEYKKLLERLLSQASDLESEMQTSAENEGLLAKIRADAASEAQAQEAEIGKLKEERDRLAGLLQALQVEGATVSSRRSAEENSIARMTAERKELEMKIAETRVKIAQTERMVDQLKQEREKYALTEEEQRAVNGYRARLGELDELKQNVAKEQQRLSEEKRGLLARQMTESEARHAAENEIVRAQTILDNMKQRLEETYSLDYEGAKELRDPDYDFSQANANINSLKHKIGALGPVNQSAVEDYEELLSRYTEMQTQKEDLDKGIVDLTGALNELRDEMQKQFDDGFNEINENFTKIFKELFGGGRAEMQLDYSECDDPLEAGVEIVACPPGKKLTKISLLSGGEQAFTAIAILFAILKSRPMPFCILDEIEAALDEANVDRFAKYLKKFSRDTQFIVITHRKPTMNQADTLFGVTMEEKGVSKIVSVKLSEVESRLGGDTVIA